MKFKFVVFLDFRAMVDEAERPGDGGNRPGNRIPKQVVI